MYVWGGAGGGDAMLLWPYPDLVVLHGGRVFQEAALVSLAQEQPSSPMSLPPPQASRGRPAPAGSRDAWGATPSPKGGVGGSGGESGGAGGDGAAAARLVLHKGFTVEDKHFVRHGLVHGRHSAQ